MFDQKYKFKTNQELANIIANPEKYVSEAVASAKLELENRQKQASTLSDEYTKSIEEEKQRKPSKRSKKRSKGWFRYTKSLLRLVRRPDTHRINTSTKNRILLTLRFYWLVLLFLLISSLPWGLVELFFSIESPQQRSFIPSHFTDEKDLLFVVLLIPIMASITEESMFRLVLSKFNKRIFDFFVALCISFLVLRIFGHYFIAYSKFYSSLLIQFSFVYFVFALVVFFNLQRTEIHSTWFEKNWMIAYKYFFYTLPCIFAIAHLPTFDSTFAQLIFWPFIILPFLIYAFVFQYVRVRIGFLYAVILHFMIDLIAVFLKQHVFVGA